MLSRPSFFPRFIFLLQIVLVSLFLAACGSGGGGGDDTPQEPEVINGFSTTTVHASDFQSSPLCPGGGVEIHTGVDVNQNGLLDEDEINGTQELCHLESDRIMAVVEPLSVDSECAFGGNRLKIGYDQNKNDLIDADEVNQSLLLCHQQALSQLAMAVFRYDAEPEGSNCTYGGTRQSVGIDRNANGLLDEIEITSSQYQCVSNLPAIPVSYSEYCDYNNCDEVIDEYVHKLVMGEPQEAYLGHFYDDGIADVTLSLDANAPEWLSLTLERQNYYTNIYTYYIKVDQANIPLEAADKAFDVRITIIEGEHRFDMLKKIKVIRPIGIKLSADDLRLTEPGMDNQLFKFINVEFDRPLPDDLGFLTEFDNNDLTRNLLTVDRLSEGEASSISQNNDDFQVSWLGDSLYPGQTEATIMLQIKDDALPESEEHFRITFTNPYFYSNTDFRFLEDSIDFSILDDADQAISATIELDSSEIVEGSLTESSTPVDVSFTLKFDRPLPSNASISLKIRPLDGEIVSSYTRDLGFDNNCYRLDYYCADHVYLSLSKGQTEYTSTIKIRSDHSFEENERFELKLMGKESTFKLNEVSAILTIIDDDLQPEIGFEETSQQLFYKTSLAYLPVKLSATSFEKITFSLDVNAESTMLEGVHFDFGLSMPITLQSGRSEFRVPILLYGEEFEAESLKAVFDIKAVEGAVVSSLMGSHSVILDKVSTFSFSEYDLVVPLSSGNISSRYLFMDEHNNYYKSGRVDGVISGQTAVGEYDLFVAKFNAQKQLVWARQFGSESSDYSQQSVYDARSKQTIVTSSDLLYVVNTDGEIKDLSIHFDNIYFNLVNAKSDEQGNLYIAGYKSTSIDLDADGFRTSFVLMKFNPTYELQWVQEDFSDFSDMTNSNYSVDNIHFELTESGVPLLFGTVYASTFNGDLAIGSKDYFVTRLDPANGALINGHLFGSNNYDDHLLHIAPFGADQLIAFYNIDSGDRVGGQTAQQIQAIKVLIDENGDIQDERFVVHTDNSYGIRSFRKASDGTFFIVEGASYNMQLYSSHFDAAFNLIYRQQMVNGTDSFIRDYFEHDPIRAQDGGYYLASTNDFVKIAPDLHIRN